jgi:hypothetical protein
MGFPDVGLHKVRTVVSKYMKDNEYFGIYASASPLALFSPRLFMI